MSLGTFTTLGAQALLPIFLGSFKSLRTPAKLKKKRRAARKTSGKLYDDDDDEDEDEELDEVLTMEDSLLFPVLGSVALIGLWLALKYVDKKWIDMVFGVYFSGAGVFAVHSTSDSVIDAVLRVVGSRGPVYHVRVSSGIKQVFHLPLRASSILASVPAIALPAAYVPLDRPYWLSNVLALCLGTTALALLRLDGFPTAALLLGLLLIYDIFWVFYTPVMVTVAKGIEAPIKLMAPKAGTSDMAMLGLGDVVVPGLLIALCLRFDMGRAILARPNEDITPRSRFSKVYFWTAVVSYIAGLVVTVQVMNITGHPQPALLYLSPACVIGPALMALVRGELELLWRWREEEDDEDEERDETIEAPSEVAQMARKEAKLREALASEDKKAELLAETQASPSETEPEAAQDDSWMDNTGVATATTTEKRPRRRGGKKK